MTNPTSVAIIFTSILTVAMSYFAYRKSRQLDAWPNKTALMRQAIYIFALLLIISTALNLATNNTNSSSIGVTVCSVLLLLLLFYSTIAAKTAPHTKLLGCAAGIVGVLSWLLSSTKPYSMVVMFCLVSVAFVIYKTLLAKLVDPLIGSCIDGLNSHGWLAFFLITGCLISEVVLLTGAYEEGHAPRETDALVTGWSLLGLLLLGTGFILLPFFNN